MSTPVEVSPALITPSAVGTATERADGVAKVTGRATYAVEHAGSDALHGWLVLATIARGRVTAIDTARALAHPGVEAVVDHTNAPRLADTDNGELAILQDAAVGYRGQIVAVVLATTAESAREGAALLDVSYAAQDHEVELTEETATEQPEAVAGIPSDTEDGDVDAAVEAADIVVRETYRTAYECNNPMEPHALLARWASEDEVAADADTPLLTLHDST